MGLSQGKKRQSDTVRQFSIEKLVTSKFEKLDDLALGRVKMCDAVTSVSPRDHSRHD